MKKIVHTKKINWNYVLMLAITVALLYFLFGRMNVIKENNESIMESIFTNIYDTNEWGNNNNKDYNGSSGEGSDVSVNINTYVPFVKEFIEKNKDRDPAQFHLEFRSAMDKFSKKVPFHDDLTLLSLRFSSP